MVPVDSWGKIWVEIPYERLMKSCNLNLLKNYKNYQCMHVFKWEKEFTVIKIRPLHWMRAWKIM